MNSKQPNYPQTFDEAYELVTQVMLSDDDELKEKMRVFLNNAKDDWVWIKMKLITDCYEAADAVGRDEFCFIALNDHIKNGTALQLAELFIDEETDIEYLQFLMHDMTIYRVPIATENMSNYTYQDALEKKFLGDFLVTSSVDGDEYTPLDTQEKVDAYNNGEYYEKFVWKRTKK